MCQELIKGFLCDEQSRWFTAGDIADGTGLSDNSVFTGLKRMRKQNQVFFKTQNHLVGRSMKDIIVYKYKRCSDG